MARYFQILTPNESIFDGTHKIDSAVSTAEPGFVAKLDSDGELSLCGAGNTPYGFFYKSTSRDLLKPSYDYAETKEELRANAYVTVVKGHGIFQVDSQSFVGGTIPSVGDAIYVAASGLMDTSGSTQIGVCDGNDTIQTTWNSTTTVARVSFHIPGF